jgi:hypothetical protein
MTCTEGSSLTLGTSGQATGTTLGADNGIGVAAALALLTLGPEAKLPPLECLFTVDEETGLTGAFRLDGSLLKGKAPSQYSRPQHKHRLVLGACGSPLPAPKARCSSRLPLSTPQVLFGWMCGQVLSYLVALCAL